MMLLPCRSGIWRGVGCGRLRAILRCLWTALVRVGTQPCLSIGQMRPVAAPAPMKPLSVLPPPSGVAAFNSPMTFHSLSDPLPSQGNPPHPPCQCIPAP